MSVRVRHGRHVTGFPPNRHNDWHELPEAQPIIARLGAAVDPDYPDRMEHVLRVASIVIAAKRCPTNAYAEPTL